MRIIMLSRGFAALKDGSEPQERMRSYGEIVSRLIVVLCERGGTGEKKNLASNVEVWTVRAKWQPLALWKGWRLARKLLAELKTNQPSQPILITSENPFELGLIAWLLKRKFGVPLQLQIHTDFSSLYFRNENLVNWIRCRIAEFILPRADCVRVVSERIRRSLNSKLRIPDFRITVLPVFVDIDMFRNAQPNQDIKDWCREFDYKILMAARCTKDKNIKLGIMVLREITKNYPRTALLIAGDGPERKNIELRIKNLGLERNIKLLGWRDDLPEIMKAVDIFLLTSNYEGWSRVIVEAMAAGLPIVMTDTGLAGEVVRNGTDGIVIPVGDINAAASALRRLIETPEEQRRLTQNAFQTIESFPIQTRAAYLKAFRDMWEAGVHPQHG